ncbi:MAG: single-stranded DNA-binding protein [Thermoanaerobaculia bacterium]|jgi:single-strand DNA-binding protein
MTSINQVLLIGTLAADPEKATTRTGRTIITFPLMTHRSFTSDGDPKEVTDYHRVSAAGALAERCANALRKGQAVIVNGMIINRAYESNGERKYVTEIRADEVSSLEYRKRDGVQQLTRIPIPEISESGTAHST